jgi:hypothetical protein
MPIDKTPEKYVYTNDDRMFAHVSGDHGIAGTILESYLSSLTSEFILEFLENKATSTAGKILYNLKSQLELINATAKHCENNYLPDKEIFDALTNAANKSIAFISGWCGTEDYNGHAMIAELAYTLQNDLIVKLHNTGNGIETYHDTLYDFKGVLYATEIRYLIKKENLNEQTLRNLIKILIEDTVNPAIEPGSDLESAKMFYLKIDAIMNILEAENIPSPKEEHVFSTGQRSGTCSWKSIMAFIKNSTPSYEDYLCLKYEIKLYALEKYYEHTKQINGKNLHDLLIRQVLDFACSNMAGLIKKLDKVAPNYLNIQNKKDVLKLISSIKDSIDAKVVRYNIHDRLVNEVDSYYAKSRWVGYRNNFLLVFINAAYFIIKACVALYEKTTLYLKNLELIAKQQNQKKLVSFLIENRRTRSYKYKVFLELERYCRDQNIDATLRLIALENFINNIPFPIDKQQFMIFSREKLLQLVDMLGNLSLLHVYLCTMQGEKNLRYESLLVSATIHTLLLVLSDDFINSVDNPYDSDISKFYVRYIKPLINISASLNEHKISWNNSNQGLNSNDVFFVDAEYFERLNYIVGVGKSFYKNNHYHYSDDNLLVKDFLAIFAPEDLPSFKIKYSSLELSRNILGLFLNVRALVGNSRRLGPIIDKKVYLDLCLDENYASLYGNYFVLDRELMRHDAYNCTYQLSPHITNATHYMNCGINNESKNIEGDERFDLKKFVMEKSNHFCGGQCNNVSIISNCLATFFYHQYPYLEFIKDMTEIHYSPDYTVALIYEAIRRHSQKLEYVGMQDAIFFNLFKNDNLQKQYASAPEGILSLIDMLEKNLVLYLTKQPISEVAIFLLKITVCMERNLANTYEKLGIVQRLRSINSKVPLLMKQNHKNLELSMVYVRYIKNKIEVDGVSDELICDLVKCYLNFNNKKYLLDGIPRFVWLEKMIALELILPNIHMIQNVFLIERNRVLLNDIFRDCISADLEVFKIELDFPQITFYVNKYDAYEVHLLEGTIRFGGAIQCSTPNEVFKTDLYNRFFGKKIFNGWLGLDNKFSFKVNEIEFFMFINNPQKLYRVHAWSVTNTVYHIEMLADAAENSLYNCIPSTMFDRNYDVWISDLSSYIITDKKTNLIKYTICSSGIYDVNNKLLLDLYAGDGRVIAHQFTCFESLQFIEAWQGGMDKIYINIPRYGIRFVSHDDDDSFIWDNDKRYVLAKDKNDALISGYNEYLLLKPVNESLNLNWIALIPQQNFIFNQKNKTSYLDLNFEHNARCLAYEDKGQQVYASMNEAGASLEKIKKNISLYNFNNSDSYTILNLNKDGTKIAITSCMEFFHLAYIYLNLNMPVQSYDFLKLGVEIFSGHESEVKWLKKIIDSSPVFQALTIAELRRYNPRSSHMHCAVKALAGSVLALKWDGVQKLPVLFVHDLILKAENILTEYYSTLNHIPLSMRLNALEETVSLQVFARNVNQLRLVHINAELTNSSVSTGMHTDYSKYAASSTGRPLCVLKITPERAIKAITKIIKKYTGACDVRQFTYTSGLEEIIYNFPEIVMVLVKNKAEDRELIDLINRQVKLVCRVFYESRNYYSYKYNLAREREGSDLGNILWMLYVIGKYSFEMQNQLSKINIDFIKTNHPLSMDEYNQIISLLNQIECFLPNDIKKLPIEFEYCKRMNKYKSIIFSAMHLRISNIENNLKVEQVIIDQTINLADIEKQVSSLKANILALANNYDTTIEATLALYAEHKNKLDFKQILKLFAWGDMAEYKRFTALDEQQIRKLYQLTFEFLNYAVYLQHANANNSCAHSYLQYPSILVFEYLDNKRVREDQHKFLSMLLQVKDNKFNNVLCQIPMGGGKSKVLLPLLSYLKSNGNNLCIVIVSKDMYKTNAIDLATISKQKFDQRLYEFVFSRDMKIENSYFSDLYHKLLMISKSRDYILTTPDSIQSLDLKYWEASYSDNLNSQNLEFLRKILVLLKQHGDVIVDEAHQNLQTQKELNYAIGKKQSIVSAYPKLIENTLDLFDFLEEKLNISDYVLGNKILCDEASKAEFTKELLDSLGREITKIEYTSEIREYLSNKLSSMPEEVKQCGLEDYLAVLRENITGLLVNTLSRHRNEHYGLRPDNDPIKSNIAVPYVGAKTPSANSEFASILAQINYTILSHINTSLDKGVFILILQSLKKKYMTALKISSESAENINQDFSRVVGEGFAILDVDLNDSIAVNELYLKLKDNLSLKRHALSKYILPGIRFNKLQIKSNAQNLICLFNSMQAFTGTPYNHLTLAPMLTYTKFTDYDKIVVDKIIENTLSVIHINGDNVLSQMYKKCANNGEVRAIIDQGALFKDISNYDIAVQLRDILHDSDILYILYFNEDGELSALPCDKNLPIQLIGSSEPEIIESILQSKPNKCFTYYDQRHATGTDILQMDNAQALVTINEATMLQGLLQACMRMRKLGEGQKIHLIISAQIAHNMPNVQSIIQYTEINQNNSLIEDCYIAARQKIAAVITDDLRNKLLKIDDMSAVQAMLKNACSFAFFVENNASLSEMYGEKLTLENTEDNLKSYAQTLMNKWCVALNALGQDFTETKNVIAEVIDKIIAKDVLNCKAQVYSYVQSFGSEQEQQLEMEQEIEQQKEKQVSYDYKNVNNVREHINFDKFLNKASIDAGQPYENPPVSLDYALKGYQRNWKFSDNIYLSRDFVYNYIGQSDAMLAKKEVSYVLYYKKLSNEEVLYIVLTEREMRAFMQYIKSKSGVYASIRSINGLPYFIYNPDNIANTFTDEVGLAFEQLAFFNGDPIYLLHNSSWIEQDTKSKLDILRDIIYSYHPARKDEFEILEEKFSKLDMDHATRYKFN